MKLQNSKKHFVFDFDDTLVDSGKFCGEVIVNVILSKKPNIHRDIVHSFQYTHRGLTIKDLYKRAIVEFKLEDSLEVLLTEDIALQEQAIGLIEPFDGLVELLEHLKLKDKQLHICTNRTTKTLLPILEHTNLKKYFSSITSCADLGVSKPNPSALFGLIDQSGDHKDDFMYFGDSDVDSVFAKNVGVDFLIFDHYLNDKRLFRNLFNLFFID
jgi:phosphoglycolate phosphatase-like HAD superfamily hydrolase